MIAGFFQKDFSCHSVSFSCVPCPNTKIKKSCFIAFSNVRGVIISTVTHDNYHGMPLKAELGCAQAAVQEVGASWFQHISACDSS